jgi:hypothetical protein
MFVTSIPCPVLVSKAGAYPLSGVPLGMPSLQISDLVGLQSRDGKSMIRRNFVLTKNIEILVEAVNHGKTYFIGVG